MPYAKDPKRRADYNATYYNDVVLPKRHAEAAEREAGREAQRQALIERGIDPDTGPEPQTRQFSMRVRLEDLPLACEAFGGEVKVDEQGLRRFLRDVVTAIATGALEKRDGKLVLTVTPTPFYKRRKPRQIQPEAE